MAETTVAPILMLVAGIDIGAEWPLTALAHTSVAGEDT
jgi:hypothetical protein